MLLGMGTQLSGQQKALVKLDGSASITLPAGQDREVRVAVSLPDNSQSINVTEDPLVVEVSFNNVRSSELQSQFTPKWEHGSGSVPLGLKIGVANKISQPGKYSLLLSVQPKSHPEAQKLPIELEQPSGDLDLPSKILVRRTKYLPFCSEATSTEEMPLNIRESTRKAGLSHLEFSWRSETLVPGIVAVDFPPADNINRRCGSALPQNSESILPAGCELRDVPYRLTGDFPLGVVNGNLRAIADQLTTPKTVPVEIQTRLTRWWLVVAVVPGLVLSFYLKFTLSKRIELNEVKAKAQELLDDISRDLGNFQDAKFEGKLKDSVYQLNAVLQCDDPARIETKRKDADQAWRDAVADLNSRLQAVQKSYDDWRGATLSSVTIPPLVQQKANAIRERLGNLQSYLKNRDADTGNTILQELSASLLPQLRDAGLQWQNKILELLSYLRVGNALGLPRSVSVDFDQVLKQAPPDLNRLSSNRTAAQPQDAAMLIEDMAVEYAAAQEVLEQLARRLEQAWSEINKALDPIRARLDPDTFQHLRDSYSQLVASLRSSSADPAALLLVLPNQLSSLQTQWSANMTAISPANNAQEIGDLLAKQDFLSAASKLSTVIAGKSASLLGSSVPIVPAPWPMSVSRKVLSQTFLFGSTVWPEADQPGAFRSVSLTPEQQLKRDKRTQSLIVGGIVLGYLLVTSAQSYTGTWAEVWGAFLTALAADFALDSILSKFKR